MLFGIPATPPPTRRRRRLHSKQLSFILARAPLSPARGRSGACGALQLTIDELFFLTIFLFLPIHITYQVYLYIWAATKVSHEFAKLAFDFRLVFRMDFYGFGVRVDELFDRFKPFRW